MTESKAIDLNAFYMRAKLSAAWTSVMFLYAYADLLGLYDRSLIESILEGNMPLLGAITQELKLGIAVMMSIPAMMIIISIVARNSVTRWANIVVGVIFTLVIVATLIMSSWLYYSYFGLLEVGLTVYIVWSAYRWTGDKVSAKSSPSIF